MLRQHPGDPNRVYAGTTEGLWSSLNAGQTWHRATADTVIVNDVLVDPRHPGTVLLATDRSGVLRSENGGNDLLPLQPRVCAPPGGGHRWWIATTPAVLYAGVVNDKEYGGMFVSHDAGEHWEQMNDGLAGHDIFSLRQTEESTLLAGTNRGVFAWGADRSRPGAPSTASPTSRQRRAVPSLPMAPARATKAVQPARR